MKISVTIRVFLILENYYVLKTSFYCIRLRLITFSSHCYRFLKTEPVAFLDLILCVC